MSPVGVSCVVQICVLPLVKKVQNKLGTAHTNRFRGENGVTRILKLSVAEGLRAKSEIRSMVSGMGKTW